MKLYEFVLKRNNEIIVIEHEVRETNKFYIKSGGRFDATYTQRIEKEKLNVVTSSLYNSYYISRSSDIVNAKRAFADYLNNNIIPRCESKIEKTREEIEKHRETIRSLTGE